MNTIDDLDDLVKLRAAQLRAMPVTRMLDYGMDYWDAVTLAQTPASRAWDAAAVELAEAHLGLARDSERRGDHETAVASYRRASAALMFAQMTFNADNETKADVYRRMSDAYESAARLDSRLDIQRISVPFGGGQCNAWHVRPPTDRPTPTVVLVGGQSGWGPAYHRQAEQLAQRGLSTVLFESPGQGESRLVHGLHLDSGVTAAFSAVLDVVTARAKGASPFGVWGNSFGGLLAARAALHDERFKACCVNGAPPHPEVPRFRTALEQSQAMLGVDSDARAGMLLRALWIAPDADQMEAALLVLHGGEDRLVSLEQQKTFLALSDDATLRVWEDGEHTIYNRSAERTEFVADWFRRTLISRF